jgi:glycosyltransferase involved in cell wall biosynthesis
VRESVLIDGRLIGYRHGGIASYARHLGELAPLVAPDLDIRIVVKRSVPELLDRSIQGFCPPHHRLERLAFGAEVSARRPALLHSVDYVQPMTPFARTVVTVHDLAFLDQPELLTSDSLRYYGQISRTAPEADRIIAVSDWTKHQLTQKLEIPEERISVVPNGVDHEMYCQDPSGDEAVLRRLHPAFSEMELRERSIILAVGTIEPRKRTQLLIDAFIRCQQRAEQADERSRLLIVVGQVGWLAGPTVERLRELQRSNSAIWLRDVNDRELAALYRASTLLAMPSADEGFGLPVLEAMACGLPVLASDKGALPEVVGEAGWIEKSSDVTAWGERINAILADESTRREKSAAGLRRATAYSWARTAEKTVEIYRKVLRSE